MNLGLPNIRRADVGKGCVHCGCQTFVQDENSIRCAACGEPAQVVQIPQATGEPTVAALYQAIEAQGWRITTASCIKKPGNETVLQLTVRSGGAN